MVVTPLVELTVPVTLPVTLPVKLPLTFPVTLPERCSSYSTATNRNSRSNL
jgi:hypothetical protein